MSVIVFLSIAILLYVSFIEWLFWYIPRRKKTKFKRKIKRLGKHAQELTPKQFFKLRSQIYEAKDKKKLVNQYNVPGVYILHNKSKRMYYVGQAKHVLDRVNNHFTGKGNGDVYADYKYGDRFTIRIIRLDVSGFSTLNELERHSIDAYHAYDRGYNKTRGNK